MEFCTIFKKIIFKKWKLQFLMNIERLIVLNWFAKIFIKMFLKYDYYMDDF